MYYDVTDSLNWSAEENICRCLDFLPHQILEGVETEKASRGQKNNTTRKNFDTDFFRIKDIGELKCPTLLRFKSTNWTSIDENQDHKEEQF